MIVVDPLISGETAAAAYELYPTSRTDGADLTLSLTRRQLLALLATGSLDGIDVEGDTQVLQRLLAVTDRPDPNFPNRHSVNP